MNIVTRISIALACAGLCSTVALGQPVIGSMRVGSANGRDEKSSGVLQPNVRPPLSLLVACPNPARDRVTIWCRVPACGPWELHLCNIMAREVRRISCEARFPGGQIVDVNTAGLAVGTYTATAVQHGEVVARGMVVVKR